MEEIGHRGHVSLLEVCLPSGGQQLFLRHHLTGEQVLIRDPAARLFHTDRFAYIQHGGRTQWCNSFFKWSAWRVKDTAAELMFSQRADGWDARWLEDRRLDYRDMLVTVKLGVDIELPLSVYDVRTGSNCRVFIEPSALAASLSCNEKQVLAWLLGKHCKKQLRALHLSGEGQWAVQERPWARQAKRYMSTGALVASLCHVAAPRRHRTQTSADAAASLLQGLIKGCVPQSFEFSVDLDPADAPLFNDALPRSGSQLQATDWELSVASLAMPDCSGKVAPKARVLRSHPRWRNSSTVPLWQVLQTTLNAPGMRWFGLQLLVALVHHIEAKLTAGSTLQQQQDLLGARASQAKGKRGKSAKAKGKGLLSKARGLSCRQAQLRRQQLKYMLATRRALDAERQIATCPDASRICSRERMCSPIMGLDAGVAAWLPPQDWHRITKNDVVLRRFSRRSYKLLKKLA